MQDEEGLRTLSDTLGDNGYDATGITGLRPVRPLFLNDPDGTTLEATRWLTSPFSTLT